MQYGEEKPRPRSSYQVNLALRGEVANSHDPVSFEEVSEKRCD
jgi:hypothetical protein